MGKGGQDPGLTTHGMAADRRTVQTQGARPQDGAILAHGLIYYDIEKTQKRQTGGKGMQFYRIDGIVKNGDDTEEREIIHDIWDEKG